MSQSEPQESHWLITKSSIEIANTIIRLEKIAGSEGLRVLGWRDVPFDDSMIGSTAKAVEPAFRQVFLAGVYTYPGADPLLDRALLVDPVTARAINGYTGGSLAAQTIDPASTNLLGTDVENLDAALAQN